jgi:hypothetical protein
MGRQEGKQPGTRHKARGGETARHGALVENLVDNLLVGDDCLWIWSG